jgi:hypothetical protein
MGIPNLQIAVYPNAFENDTDAQLKENAEKIVFPQIIDRLTKPVDLAAGTAKAAAIGISGASEAKAIVFKGNLEQVNNAYATTKLTDGMAIIPPTIESVEKFLKYTDIPATQEIAILPSKTTGYMKATPWNIAVNGVMAGCRPEYMPILIAAVKAMSAGSNDALGSSGTHSNIPYLWLNGPVARQLNFSHSQGLITSPINMVIGRTLNLMVQNLAGYRVNETRMGTFGYPISWVLAEDEEFIKSIGWQPYHVEQGLNLNDSAVTGNCSCMWGQNVIPSTSDPKLIMQLMAYDITYNEGFGSGSIASARTVLVAPSVAKVLAGGGYTKQTLIDDLIKTARKVVYEWTFSQVNGSFGASYPPFDQQLAINTASATAEKGKLPPWYARFNGWEDWVTIPSISKGKIQILVCGDPSRNKTQTMGGPGASAPPPPQKIELPAKWDSLMSDLGYSPLKSFYL